MTAGDVARAEERRRPALLGGSAVLVLLALLKLLVHLLTAENYGFFRDELYYIAASERLDFGYVDFPPFVALVTAFVRARSIRRQDTRAREASPMIPQRPRRARPRSLVHVGF